MKTLVLAAALCAGLGAGGPRAQAGDAGQSTTRKGQEGVVKGNLKDWSATPGLEGLEQAFQYLARTDLDALPLGRTNVQGDDIYVTVSDAETRAPETASFEAHRKYIDIQLVLRGQEAIGVAPAATLKTTQPYDAAKDIEFFAPPAQSATVALHPGDFAVFVPGDGHRPSLHLDGPHVTRKVVVKVSAAYRERQRAATR